MKNNLNIALVQTNLFWKDINKNLELLENIIEKIHSETDLIVLPEMFSTGFSMDIEDLEKPIGRKSLKWLRSISTKKNISIIGSILSSEKGKNYNRMYMVNPDGTAEYYDKRHLFHMAGEHHIMTAGTERKIINLKGWKLNLQICYDLRFPVWAKNKYYSTEDIYDYDALIYIANWPTVRRQAYLPLLQARAIENQAYVIWVNRVGKDGNQIEFSGDTRLIDPYGRVVEHLTQGAEGVLYSSLSREEIEGFRKKFKVGLDWDIYTIDS